MRIDDETKTNFQSPQVKAIVNIRHTANTLANFQNNFMAEYDLSMPQFNILRILRGAKKEINVNTVKDRMIEKSPNTTRLMDKLVEKELIERSRCEDDRGVVLVKISSKGLDLLKVIDVKFSDSSFSPKVLTDDEANLLSDLLDKLRSEYLEK